MGQYDDITPERLRRDLKGFAELIFRLDREGGLLEAVPRLQNLIGDLRQKLFAFEIRGSRLLPRESEEDAREGAEAEEGERGEDVAVDPVLRESLRVVREALRRERHMKREWEGDPSDEVEEGDEDDV